MDNLQKEAVELHKQVLPNWYYQSIKVDPFQRFWHWCRFEEVSKIIEPVGGERLICKDFGPCKGK